MTGVTILANDRDIQLVKRTVAQDLTPSELDLFIHMCRQWRLDPLRRQIYAQVYKRKKKEKDEHGKDQWVTARNVVYVTAIDGYRAIADRTGSYRPGQRSVVTDESAKNPDMNPQGIVSATASVWKFAHGEWHEFSETVYWEEFAPIKEIWADNKATGKFKLDTSGQWGRMGRVMLQKCAEGQALRRGWPDEYGDLYVSEEMDQAKVIDITPSEQAERAEKDARFALIGGKEALTIDWCDGSELQRIPAGQFGDRALAYIRTNRDEPMSVLMWAHRNRHALKEYWALDKSGALAVKTELEKFQREAAE